METEGLESTHKGGLSPPCFPRPSRMPQGQGALYFNNNLFLLFKKYVTVGVNKLCSFFVSQQCINPDDKKNRTE